ncbi:MULTISPECIES: GNAT family N-acetyltransferase [Rheinheimera]|uniref:GNAT family N-acetyltransferase n=1 Tax=Rheinheimera marina TaxID=1774958 RepID=A0ABV9JQC8_9GAMM
MELRALTPADLTALLDLQGQCYPAALNESAAVMGKRLEGFASTCWGAFSGQHMQAYLLTYPSLLGKISALGADFSSCVKPDALYLHDMAVSSASRGAGLAAKLLLQAELYARHHQLSYLTLVAVQGAEGYWQKQGFVAAASLTATQQRQLASYLPETAFYMHKAIQ